MGVRRGSWRRHRTRPLAEPRRLPGRAAWEWGRDFAPEWGGAASLPPLRPRFGRRLALLLFWLALAVALLLPLACAASRARRTRAEPPLWPEPKAARPG